MSDIAADTDYLLQLADEVCDERASADDLSRLDAILLASNVSRRCYLEYCQMHIALGFELRAQHAAQKLCRQIDFGAVATGSQPTSCLAVPLPSVAPTSSPSPAFVSTTLRTAFGYFSEGMPLAYLLATVIFGVGLLIGSRIYVSGPDQVARDLSPATNGRTTCDSQMPFVGRITGMVDCHWADKSATAVNGAYVSLGRKYALDSGLMEITYDTGAKVILDGPVTYEVESTNGGFLSIGRLTGKVENRNAKGFAVHTPTATVIDLGTEFGVEVSEAGITETHVFTGTVKLEGRAEAGGAAEQLLLAGQAARLDPHVGTVEVVNGGTEHFVRKMPVVKPGGSCELIDQVDYSDTWTANSVTRPGSYLMLVDLASMRVEQCHGNPLRSWVFGTESAMTTYPRYDKSAIVWPGFQVQGARSGFLECGGDCYLGFEYGLRDDFVVQFDAVQTDNRMNITIGEAPATVEGAGQLSVFIRSAGATSLASGLTASEIGVYCPLLKTGEIDTELRSGIAKARQWHNYAVRFNLPAKRATVWVDRQRRGTIDLAAIKRGDNAAAWDELSVSNRYVSIGGYNGGKAAGPIWTPLWVDNFRIGSPRLTNESPATPQGVSASSPQRGGD